MSVSSSHSDDPTLENCLVSAVTFTKNADDIDNYGYSGYGYSFDLIENPAFHFQVVDLVKM